MINFQIYKNGQQIEFEKNNAQFNDKTFQSLFILLTTLIKSEIG